MMTSGVTPIHHVTSDANMANNVKIRPYYVGVDILVNSMAKTLVNYSEFWYILVSDYYSLLVLQEH